MAAAAIDRLSRFGRATRVATFLAFGIFPVAAASSVAAQYITGNPNSRIVARLTDADPALADGRRNLCVAMLTRAGRPYAFEMMSEEFDTAIAAGPGGQCEWDSPITDNNSGVGRNSALLFTGDGALWSFRMTSASPGGRGAYTARIVDVSQPRSYILDRIDPSRP